MVIGLACKALLAWWTVKPLYVTGEIITRVHHINEGMPCERSGTFEFHAKGQRQYWRMQQIDNPCDRVADYIDVYFN